MGSERKATPTECEALGCENLPVFEYTGTVVKEDGTTDRRDCYLCIACASGLLENECEAEVKLDVESCTLILRR